MANGPPADNQPQAGCHPAGRGRRRFSPGQIMGRPKLGKAIYGHPYRPTRQSMALVGSTRHPGRSSATPLATYFCFTIQHEPASDERRGGSAYCQASPLPVTRSLYLISPFLHQGFLPCILKAASGAAGRMRWPHMETFPPFLALPCAPPAHTAHFCLRQKKPARKMALFASLRFLGNSTSGLGW